MPVQIDPSWFGGRLRELREAAGLSRIELAQRAGLAVGETDAGYARASGIENLEQGRTLPSWEMACTLANALGVGLDAFGLPPQPDTGTSGPGRPKKKEDK